MGEPPSKDQGVPFVHRDTNATEFQGTGDLRICPHCGETYPALLHCPHCEATGDLTFRRDDIENPFRASGEIGECDLEPQQPVIFEINGQKLVLPIADVMVIGRRSHEEGKSQPDVDLGSFETYSKSVSRRHLRLRRKEMLIYVTDLGSSNGTWLNGHRLLKRAERPLRNGDELRLGTLKITVRYRLE